MNYNTDANLFYLLSQDYQQQQQQSYHNATIHDDEPSSHGTKHKYASSVSTQSTTQSRRPPAPKKRREQPLQLQLQQQQQQQQSRPLINDDEVSISAFISDRNPTTYEQHQLYDSITKPEDFNATFSPASFQDSGVSSPDDPKELFGREEEDIDNVMKIMALQEKVTELQHQLADKEYELDLYQKYMHFPIDFVKERARETFDQQQQTEHENNMEDLTVDMVLLSLLHSPSKPSGNVALPFAMQLFQQEWMKKLGKKSSRAHKDRSNKTTKKSSEQQLTKSNQDTGSIVTWGKHSSLGSAIYISASSTATSSNHSFMSVSTTNGPRIQMIAGTMNQKVDKNTRQILFDQFINGTISHQSSSNNSSPTISSRNKSSSPNSNSTIDNEEIHNSANTKLTETESMAVKETAKQCFMSFNGKMIIENEADRLEYLQEHCHGLTPSSLPAAVDYFKQELEKVRNKTKKQLLRFQNYNTEKWDQPIEKVCYLILGKSRWEKLSDREKKLITGKYAFLRMSLEELKKRNAKIKWDKLQDDFERCTKPNEEDNYETLCGYWLSVDQRRFEQRKELESQSPPTAIPISSNQSYSQPIPLPPLPSEHSLIPAANSTIPSSIAPARPMLDHSDILLIHQQQQHHHHITPLDTYLS